MDQGGLQGEFYKDVQELPMKNSELKTKKRFKFKINVFSDAKFQISVPVSFILEGTSKLEAFHEAISLPAGFILDRSKPISIKEIK